MIPRFNSAARSTVSSSSSSSIAKKTTAAPASASRSADAFSSFKRAPVQLGRVPPPPPPRSVGPAIAESRALFVGSNGGAGTIGGTVTDYRPATSTSFSTAAQAQLEKNRALEAQKLATLPRADQQSYREVQAALKTDPTAQLAMQTMLLEDRLPGARDLRDGKTLLEQLHGLSTQKVSPDLAGKGELLAQVVKEVFIPASIAQENKLTCGAVSSLQALAKASPAEYVRLVSGLASPAGEVQLANGDAIRREPGTLADDGTGRTTSQRLLDPALMEYANGFLDYDGATDRSAFVVPGMTTGMQAHLLEGLFNRNFQDQIDLSAFQIGMLPNNGKERLANAVVAALDAGESPVTVSMNFPTPDKGHFLVVDHVERSPEGDFVVLTNPWGQEERVPFADFQAHLTGMVSPD